MENLKEKKEYSIRVNIHKITTVDEDFWVLSGSLLENKNNETRSGVFSQLYEIGDELLDHTVEVLRKHGIEVEWEGEKDSLNSEDTQSEISESEGITTIEKLKDKKMYTLNT